MSQDTLPSPLAIGCLTKYYYSHCATSDVYGTPVTTTVNTAVTIAFSNTVRAERSEDRHRVTPTGVCSALLAPTNKGNAGRVEITVKIIGLGGGKG